MLETPTCAGDRKGKPANLFWLAGIVFCALGTGPSQAKSSADSLLYNVLTPVELAQGWQLMFDGKTLDGWHSFRKTTISTGGWAIQDSALYRSEQAAGAILAPEKFVLQDFDISIDWRTPDAGNSGIFLRYLETESSENIRTGPESQICGKLHPDYGTGTGLTSAGACYAMYPPAREWIRPADQYNTFRVIMFGKRVAQYGNGKKLLEYEIGSADWTSRYQASKYAIFPLYGDVHAGKLFLQDHGSPVWFRNIKIRPLTQNPWSDSSFVWPDQAVAGIRARMVRFNVYASGKTPGTRYRGNPSALTGGTGVFDGLGRDLAPVLRLENGIPDRLQTQESPRIFFIFDPTR